MLNLLKTDFYKALRTTSFWVISIIIALISAFVSWSYSYMYTSALENRNSFSNTILETVMPFFEYVPGILFSFTFLIGIFSIMFSTSDFSYGTIKNTVSKGYRREFIYLSKFITALGFAAISILISFITSFITVKLMIKNKIPGFFKFSNIFLEKSTQYALQMIASISIAIFLAMFIRSLGPSLAIFLAFVFFRVSAIRLIDEFIHNIFESNFSIMPYTIIGAFSDPSHIARGVIVLLAYIVIINAAGIYAFKKHDIN